MRSFIYLFRHGKAVSAGTLIGQTDCFLTPEGEQQAHYWRKELHGLRFRAAWSSPLARARQTADIILSNGGDAREIRNVPDLRELSLGTWENRHKDWIRENYPKEWKGRGLNPADIAPPGGESFVMLAERVLPAFTALCANAAAHPLSLIVAHQAVNRIILAKYAGIPLHAMHGIPQPLAALNILEITEEGKGVRLAEQRFVPGTTVEAPTPRTKQVFALHRASSRPTGQ